MSTIRNSMTRRAWIRRSALVALAIIALTAIYAVLIEPNRLVTTRAELVVHGWTGGPLRIAMVSDIHVGSLFMGVSKVRSVVDRVNAESPDLVVLLGDYVRSNRGDLNSDVTLWQEAAKELLRLHPRLGTYAVLGNHDCWHDAKPITEALEQAHVTVLVNQSLRLSNGTAPFWIWGLADLWEQTIDYAGPLRGIPETESVLALSHNPDVFPQIEPRVPLTLAGHTHGGQVALPLIGRLKVPSKYGERYAIGHVEENGHQLFVTSGVGTSIIPIRLGVPPEIAVLTIHASPP